MDYTDIIYTVDPQEHIARITLNKPEMRNPLGPNMIGEINHALCAARDDPEVRVVILTGAGKAFSAGGDLSQMGQSPRNGLTTSFVDLNLLFTRLGKPVIAMIDGPCMAGGLGLVCACHPAGAAETAVFGTPEGNRGLWPMTIMANIFRAAASAALDESLKARFADVLHDPLMVSIMQAAGRQLAGRPPGKKAGNGRR